MNYLQLVLVGFLAYWAYSDLADTEPPCEPDDFSPTWYEEAFDDFTTKEQRLA